MSLAPLQISYTLGTIENAADQLWQYGNQYRIWAFSGQLGAGKTTLVHALCDMLGVQDNVSSPTFALINEYRFTDKLLQERTIFHMDWYRLKSVEEAIDTGMEDNLHSGKYCFIEWPEQAPELLTMSHLWITIEATGLSERELTATVVP